MCCKCRGEIINYIQRQPFTTDTQFLTNYSDLDGLFLDSPARFTAVLVSIERLGTNTNLKNT